MHWTVFNYNYAHNWIAFYHYLQSWQNVVHCICMRRSSTTLSEVELWILIFFLENVFFLFAYLYTTSNAHYIIYTHTNWKLMFHFLSDVLNSYTNIACVRYLFLIFNFFQNPKLYQFDGMITLSLSFSPLFYYCLKQKENNFLSTRKNTALFSF